MRTFTVDEANAALPRVQAVVERVRELAAARSRATASADHPSGVGHGRPSSNGERGPGSEADKALHATLDELERDGIVLRDAERGLVDFPAVAPSGRSYWLCWVVGEPEVAWWHWQEDGFAGRTPITEPPE